jgi:putative ABC transport system substrate-binding protein
MLALSRTKSPLFRPSLFREKAIVHVGGEPNPATAPYAEIYLGPFGAAAAALAVEAIAMSVGDTSELESAVGGFVVIPDPFMSNRSAQITSLTARDRLPAIFPFRFYAKFGGLLSYGSDQ